MGTPLTGDTARADWLALTVATLNTMGISAVRSGLRQRYAAIGGTFEGSAVDVVLCQEVFTYYHLCCLKRYMPSYAACYRPSLAGPAGGLVTFSKVPCAATVYSGFPSKAGAGLRMTLRARARIKGVLVTRFAVPGPISVINTHLLANADGDWSETSKVHRAQAAQLLHLEHISNAQQRPVLVAGDFNMAPNSPKFEEFLGRAGLTDVFARSPQPTIRPEYLPAGAMPQRIDFILVAGPVQPKDHGSMFGSHGPADGAGPVSDHLGLFATALIPRSFL
jgi:endonuclease/exonuclease/phosphatase (EEP) superfamily protein YafD